MRRLNKLIMNFIVLAFILGTSSVLANDDTCEIKVLGSHCRGRPCELRGGQVIFRLLEDFKVKLNLEECRQYAKSLALKYREQSKMYPVEEIGKIFSVLKYSHTGELGILHGKLRPDYSRDLGEPRCKTNGIKEEKNVKECLSTIQDHNSSERLRIKYRGNFEQFSFKSN